GDAGAVTMASTSSQTSPPGIGVPPVPGNASAAPELQPVKIGVNSLSFFYGEKRALDDISIELRSNQVTAFIGPSGCGKSTFLRTLNRMNETVRNSRVEGKILLDGVNILEQEVAYVRRRVGMVFQRSNPFPKSIFDNIAYGPRINGTVANRAALREKVEQSLHRAALWNEVKDI